MKRVKLETVEDIEALPEGEWVYVPGGIKFIEEFEPGLRPPRRATSNRKNPRSARGPSRKKKAGPRAKPR